jgi:hypothetical protein
MSELRSALALAQTLSRTGGVSPEGEIEQLLDRARILIEETGAELFSAELHAARAEWMRSLGDEEGWRRQLEQARDLYSAMGADGHAERLRGELGG